MPRNFVPRGRNTQGWEEGMDEYNDIPDDGLAGTEAFESAMNVGKKLTPDGLKIEFVDNDNRQFAYTVTWSELAALAAGQNPSDPRIGIDGWRMVADDDGSRFPCWVHRNDYFEGRAHPKIEVHEANGYLQQGAARGFLARDPHFPRVRAAIKAITGR